MSRPRAILFDVFGTLVDWHTSITAALAGVGGRAGIDADWPALARAWRARYRPTLGRVVAGELPFQPDDDDKPDAWGAGMAADAARFRKR